MQKNYLKTKDSEEKAVSFKDSQKHMSWCFANNITIWLEPLNYKGGIIVVNYKGQRIEGCHVFVTNKLKPTDVKWWTVISKMYTQYYNEENKLTIKTKENE